MDALTPFFDPWLRIAAPWLAALMAVLIVIDARQTPKRILAAFGDGNRAIVRLYVEFGMWAVRAWFLFWFAVLALAWAVLVAWLEMPALFTLGLLPFLAAQIYCVAGNFKRGFFL